MSWLKPSTDKRKAAVSPRRQDAAGREPGPPGSNDPSAMPPRKSWALFAAVLLINYLLVRLLFPADAAVTVPYTFFKQQVAQGNVETIYSQGASIEGRFSQPVTWPPSADNEAKPGPALTVPKPRAVQQFATTLPAFVGPNLEQFLIDHKVEISAVPIQTGSGWGTLLFGFGPALLIIAFYVWLYRRAAQAGGLGDGGWALRPGRQQGPALRPAAKRPRHLR